MITVTYAMAIVRLAGQKALIQRSNAVESMSRVSVLCLDKTGTLTTPEIEVAEVHALGDEAELARWLGAFVASTSLQNRSSDAIRERFPDGEAVAGRGGGAVLVRAALERHPGRATVTSRVLWCWARRRSLGPHLAAAPGGHACDGPAGRREGRPGPARRPVRLPARRPTVPLLDADDQAGAAGRPGAAGCARAPGADPARRARHPGAVRRRGRDPQAHLG